MNIIKYKDNLILISILVFSLIYLKLLFETFFFGSIPMHDTLWAYSIYQYIFNHFEIYNSFPSWIDTNNGGMPALGVTTFSTSIVAIPLVFFSKIIGINSYYSYLLLMSFFTSIFALGTYILLKEIIKNYFYIFFLILLSYLFSSDYFFILQSHWWYTILPFQIFFLVKYFKLFDEKYLFLLVNSHLIFSILYSSYYNIFSTYLLLIIFLIFVLFNKIPKKKILKIFSKKNYFNFLFLTILILINLVFYLYFKDNYQINTSNRLDDLSVLNYGNTGNIPFLYKLKKILFGEYTQSFYSVGVTNLVLIFSVYIFLNLKKFKRNYNLLSFLLISILIALISCGNEFLISEYFVMFLRFLPFMDLFKHYGYIFHFLIPLSLFITAISFDNFLESKNKTNIFLACFLTFLIKLFLIIIFFYYYPDHYNEIFKKEIILNLFLSYSIIILSFFIYIYYKKINISFFLFFSLLLISFLPDYNLSFKKYDKINNLKFLENYFFKNNINTFKKKCISYEKAIEKLEYFNYMLLLSGNKYNIINLNLERKICEPFAKIPIDGSKKENSKYLFSGQAIHLKNTNFNNALYLLKIFEDKEDFKDINLDGTIDNEDKYLFISKKTKIPLWVVVFRIQFAESYLNKENPNNRFPSIKFYKNENDEWIVYVNEKDKERPLYKIVDKMVIKNSNLKKDNYIFYKNLQKKGNIYHIYTKNNKENNLKLSYNRNWKVKNISKNKIVEIKNKNGFLNFNQKNDNEFELYYYNKLEIFILACQLVIMLILVAFFTVKIKNRI